MSFKFHLTLLISSLFITSFSYAQEVDKKIVTSITQGLTSSVPGIPKIDEIRATALSGIYEVRHSGNEIFYSSADGSYLIQGVIIDTKNKKNLTQDRLSTLNAIDFKKLPLKDSFKIVKGNGKRKLAVFEDPNCGYCKQFEKQMEDIKDVTVYLFLFPVLGADSVSKANDIWCAKDQKKVWQDWMLKGIKIPELKCTSTPIERNIELGKKYKINGTPTIIFEDGTKIPGAITANQIEDKFQQISKK